MAQESLPAIVTDNPTGQPTYPAALLISCLLFQLALLAWSAFPARTMKADQPLECWLFLAGGQAVFASLIWPISRPGRSAWRQVALEGVLLIAASVPMTLAAAIWVDASREQVLVGGGYVLAWLVAGGLAAGSPSPVRWLYCLVLTLANLGLLGLGYVWLDFLGADPGPMWRLCPMFQASRLAATGWTTTTPDRLPSLAPVFVMLILAIVCLIPVRRDRTLSVPAKTNH